MNYEWVLNLWRASLNPDVAATIPPVTGAPVVLPSNGILAADERLGTKCTILFRFVFCEVRREIWWEVTGSHRPASRTPLIAACALEESFDRWLAWIWILVLPLWSSFRVRLITELRQDFFFLSPLLICMFPTGWILIVFAISDSADSGIDIHRLHRGVFLDGWWFKFSWTVMISLKWLHWQLCDVYKVELKFSTTALGLVQARMFVFPFKMNWTFAKICAKSIIGERIWQYWK